MEAVNGYNREAGLPEVQMGIAVNTGDVVVGNIGSQTRAKYGVVGTHVNLAGRIEGFTVGGQILVSETTLRRSGGSLTVGERLTFEAKGFKDPVVVHDLRGVGGRHQLFLPAWEDALVPLASPLPVSVTMLDGKQMGAATFEGALVAAGRASAALRTATALPPLSNLRLRIAAAGGNAEIYAKVTGTAAEGAVTLRFTSADPEATRLIEQALAG
jgi:adenylate cyclase